MRLQGLAITTDLLRLLRRLSVVRSGWVVVCPPISWPAAAMPWICGQSMKYGSDPTSPLLT